MDSILNTIKKLITVEETDHFDIDLIIHINTTLLSLTQLGVGPKEGFSIIDETATWHDFLGDDKRLEAVKSYVYIKAKLFFDPPQSGTLIEAYNNSAKELEWRLNVAVEGGII